MNKAILNEDVQSFLAKNETTSPAALALKKSPFDTITASELAQQLDGRLRCKYKLPLWYNTPGIYFPPKLAIEQCSSATAAQYKASLLPDHTKIIDITGGMGVDSYYFSTRAETVSYCERNPELAAIVKHNATVLHAPNLTCFAGDGISYIINEPNDTFDVIYIDPSRRKAGQKVYRLQDCEPDIDELQHVLMEKAATVIVKVAPMLDISAVIGQLKHIYQIHIVSVDNDCKELLFILKRDFNGIPDITAIDINSNAGEYHPFCFTLHEEQQANVIFGHPEQFLYAPHAAAMKSGAYKLFSSRFGLKKLHSNTHLYTSEQHITNFPGNIFNIHETIPYSIFKKEKNRIAGNVVTRNFPLKADELRKKHRIKEHKHHFLFFCIDVDDKHIVISASK